VSLKKKEAFLYILVKKMNSSHKDQFFKEILILFFFRLTYARVSDVLNLIACFLRWEICGLTLQGVHDIEIV